MRWAGYSAVSAAAAVVVVAGTGSLAEGAGGTNEHPRSAVTSRSGEFVGRVAIGAYVAVTAERSRTGPRAVHAYICDGRPRGRAEWFKTTSRSNTFDLRTVRGSDRIQFTITANGVRGKIILSGGRRIRFKLVPAHNGAGLYQVQQTADGRWSGHSDGGARIRARDRSHRRVVGTVTLPSGRRIPYRVRQVRGSGGVGRYVAIVIPPYGVKGRDGSVTLGMPSMKFYLGSFIM